jgi:hypothetical protein
LREVLVIIRKVAEKFSLPGKYAVPGFNSAQVDQNYEKKSGIKKRAWGR